VGTGFAICFGGGMEAQRRIPLPIGCTGTIAKSGFMMKQDRMVMDIGKPRDAKLKRLARWWLVLAGVVFGVMLAAAQTDEPEVDEQSEPNAPAQGPTGEGSAREEAAADTSASADDSPYAQLEIFTESLLHIKKRYVDEKTYKEIIYGALHGMLEKLDQHSAFLEREEYSELQDDTAGKFSGIGIHIGIKNGVLTIIAPIEDTPGFRAGLQSGDAIVEIDGQKTAGITLREAVKRMRGPKGTRVTLTIRRQDEEMARKVEIIRDDIVVPSVKGARIIADGVGYVRVTQFTEPTAEHLRQAITNLLTQKMEALVLDLRSNPGGLLKSAIEVAQLFLRKDDLIVTTRGRKGVTEEVQTRAGGQWHFVDFPMVVLVNGGSASASEIVAGALRDNRRAILLGTTTFGKGSVQSLIPLSSDQKSALRLTVARYYTPNGRQIHEKGIDPDIPVYVTPEEWRKVQIRRAHLENPEIFSEEEKKQYAEVVDRQLQRAVDLLQALKIFR